MGGKWNKQGRGCITVLSGLVTLDELAASENGEMGASHEGQNGLQEARPASGEVSNLVQMEANVVARYSVPYI